MSSHTPTDVSYSTATDLAPAELFDALSNERRQFVIRTLADGDTTLSELATALAREETDTEHDHAQRKAAYVGLYQHHLDALAAHAIIAWDQQSGAVTPGPNHDRALRTLQFATDEAPLLDRVRGVSGGGRDE